MAINNNIYKIIVDSNCLLNISLNIEGKNYKTIKAAKRTIKAILKKSIYLHKDKLAEQNINVTPEFIQNTLTDEFINKCIEEFIVIDNAQELKQYFNENPNDIDDLIQQLSEEIIPIFVENIKLIGYEKALKLTLAKTFLTKFITQKLIQFYNEDNFCIAINNRHRQGKYFLTLKIIDSEIEKITPLIIKAGAIKQLVTDIKNLSQESIEKKINTESAVTDLNSLGLKQGDEIDIDNETLLEITMNDTFLPVVYINGNVLHALANSASSNDRDLHDDLLELYSTDMSYHKYDLEKRTASEWKKLDIYDYDELRSLHCVRAVKKDDSVLLYDGGEFTVEASNAIANELSCKVFALNESQACLRAIIASHFTYIPGRLIKKCHRLMKLIRNGKNINF